MNKVVLTKKDHQEIRRLKGKVSVKNIQKQYKIGTERVYRIFKNIEPIAETDEIIEKQMVEEANLEEENLLLKEAHKTKKEVDESVNISEEDKKNHQ